MSEPQIGATLYISTVLPATNDTAGFEALTWTRVNGLIQEPQFGLPHEAIAVPNLTTGFTVNKKGAAQGMSSEMQFFDVASDTGQASLIAAAKGRDGDIALKVGYGTGTDNALVSGDEVVYAQGLLHTYSRNQGTTTSFKGFSVTFQQNAIEVEATEPV